MATPLKIAITGIAGRMGQSIAREVLSRGDTVTLGAGFARENSVYIGKDIGEVLRLDKIGLDVQQSGLKAINSDVMIDFSHPSALSTHLEWCLEHKIPLVLGTTGLSDENINDLKNAANVIPILCSGNMSIGIALMQDAVQTMAKALGSEFDIEIIETHHRHKKDAPSGTAYMLAEAAAEGRGVSFKNNTVTERHGETGERPAGAIGLQAIRGGEVIGDHTVMFLGPSERLEITHKAIDRGLFSKGAVDAACWLGKQSEGLYSLQDMLKS